MESVRSLSCLLCAWALLAAACLTAQTSGPSTEDLQKQTQNPVSSLISGPFQNNTNFPIGHYSRSQDVLNIQPVIPMTLNQHWNLIIRVIAPLI